jgi:hypothetical protein
MINTLVSGAQFFVVPPARLEPALALSLVSAASLELV